MSATNSGNRQGVNAYTLKSQIRDIMRRSYICGGVTGRLALRKFRCAEGPPKPEVMDCVVGFTRTRSAYVGFWD